MSQLKYICLCVFVFSFENLLSQKQSTNPYPWYVDTAKVNQLKRKNHVEQKDSIKITAPEPKSNTSYSVSEKPNFRLESTRVNDSLQNIKESLNKKPKRYNDSLGLKKLVLQRDSFESTKKKLKDRLHKKSSSFAGTITNQLDYGAVPYYLNEHAFPAVLFRSTGDLKMKVMKIPLMGEYFYSNPKYVSGLNNYLTIRFDVEEFQKMRNKEYLGEARKMRSKVDSLSAEKLKLNQQLTLLEKVRAAKLPSPPQHTLPENPNLDLSDSLAINTKVNVGINSYSLAGTAGKIDTSTAKIREIQNSIEMLDNQTKLLNQRINAVEYPKPESKINSLFPGSKFSKSMEGIKKFEIGMCYPAYSVFMINQMAIKGINTKYELKNMFFNASYGKTVVNYSVQPSSNQILREIQEMSGFLDWNKNPEERKIGAAKIGFGKENKSYFGIGGLFGKGRSVSTASDIKKNYVVELDGRIVFKFITVEAAFAKSYIINKSDAIFEPEFSSPAQTTKWSKSLQTKIFGSIPKLNTKFQVQYRTIEPYFKSFGLGFIRSDIVRYETKLEQPLGKKLKLGINYRRDEDNMKNLHDYKTILENYTYLAKIKLFRRKMDIAINYSEIFQKTDNRFTNENIKVKTTIKTGIISYLIKVRRLLSTNTLLSSFYTIQDARKTNSFNTHSFNSNNQYRKWILNSLNSYNHSTITDSLNFTNAINNVLEGGYQFSDNFKVLLGLKHAYQMMNKTSQFGYSLTLNLALHRLVNLELKAEKLVIGDYINTLNYSSISQFPYYGYIKLASNF